MKKFILIIVLALSANLFLNNFAIGQNNEPIGCNGQYYVSHGNSGNANGNTLLKKLSFSGSTISATAFGLNPSTYGFNAIGLNPIDGYIYAIRYPNGSNEPHLVKIGNGGTNVHDLGEIDGGSGGVSNEDICYAACFDSNGDFYFVDNTREELRKITNANLNGSRSSSLVGSNSAYGTIYDIAINPVTGQMYGTNSSTNSNYLVAINKSNGNLSTAVGPNMGGAGYFAGLFFDEVGELYGYRADGGFYQINKSTGALTAAGSGASYTYADGCSCTFGRVYHDLDFTANPSNQICPSAQTPNPSFPLDVIVHNKSNAQQTGLTYTLDISDPAKRFRFTQSAATIKANIVAAGLGTNGGTTVTLSTVAPATGTNYNKVVVTGFQTGPVNSDKTFTLQVQLYTTGGTYNPIPLQSEITGLPVVLGSSDLSNDPTSIPPDDATVISFCPNITLPVTLVSFTGVYKNHVANLYWRATNMTNFSFYELQRSENGIDFSGIVTKPTQNLGSMSEEYDYVDDMTGVSSDVIYYRLKMVDIDGTFKYSNVILVKRDQQPTKGISITPNPVVNTDNVTVRFYTENNQRVDLKVVDMAGRTVMQQMVNATSGNNSITLNNINKLQAGVYLIQMVKDGETSSVKFIKAK